MDDSIVKLAIGIAAPAFAAWSVVRVARIRSQGKPTTPDEATPDGGGQQFDGDFELRVSRYVDERVAFATKELRDDLDKLKDQVGRVTRVLRILREAFRRYIREVARTWGKSPTPPLIDEHIRDLLLDDDLDNTFGSESMADLRRQIPDT